MGALVRTWKTFLEEKEKEDMQTYLWNDCSLEGPINSNERKRSQSMPEDYFVFVKPKQDS